MWPFGKKSKEKKEAKAAEQKSADIREQALAQFRQTQAELGPETIAAMKRAADLEKVKNKIKDAIDDKEGSNREAVLETLKDLKGK